LFRVTFLCLVALFLYVDIFYASASTPVATASKLEWLDIISLSLVIPALVALLVHITFFCIALVFKPVAAIAPGLRRGIAIVLLSCLALLLLENWVYSVFTIGLKTGESTITKLLFLAGAIYIGMQFTGGLLWLAHRLKPIIYIPIIVTASIAFAASWEIPDKQVSDTSSTTATTAVPVNILLISSDGIDASALSIYGNSSQTTPFLDSIASELMVFENAYSNSGNTTGGITALLTGLSPLVTKVVYPPDILKNEKSLHNLPSLLSRTRYLRTQWSVPHYASADEQNMLNAFDIINGEEVSGLAHQIARFDLASIQIWLFSRLITDQIGVVKDVLFIEELDNPFMQVAEESEQVSKRLSDAERLQGLLGDIDAAQSMNKLLFTQVHFMNTHGPKFSPPIRVFSKGLEQDRAWMPPFYNDALLNFDHMLSIIYKELEVRGLLDNTLLAITSDHGKGWNQTARIPLLFRLSRGAKAGRYSANVQSIDVAPTIVSYIGKSLPPWMEGISLLSASEIPSDRLIFSAGARGTEKGTKGWIRSNDQSFRTANKFLAVYCDRATRLIFPSAEPRSFQLEGNSSPEDCMSVPAEELSRLALEVLNGKLD
jgi:hypothetical protein